MSEEKKDLEELQSEELKDVNGGNYTVPTSNGRVYINGESGSYCGEKSNGVITYRPCPRCNKPMHTEVLSIHWFCDPCDFSEYRPREEVWNGTEEELRNAAK